MKLRKLSPGEEILLRHPESMTEMKVRRRFDGVGYQHLESNHKYYGEKWVDLPQSDEVIEKQIAEYGVTNAD